MHIKELTGLFRATHTAAASGAGMGEQECVLLGCSTDSIISAWDLHTGTQLTSYKSNASPCNGLCRVGPDYLVAAQNLKDALLFWTWHKDQVLQRSFAMERLTAVAASPDGALLAAGGVSGALYVWELGSGRLLRNWAAHYKAVSCIAFTSSGAVLVSGSEDTLVSCWVLAGLVDSTHDSQSSEFMRPLPLHSWSDHTLPVTGLAVSQGGCEGASLVVSSSLDRTLKMHRLSDGVLLAVASLPSAVTCVALDAGEHAMYAGATDGAIYEVGLVGEAGGVTSNLTLLGGLTDAPGMEGGGATGGAWGLLGGACAVLRPHARMAAHSRAVSSVCLSLDGELLVSGSEDGTAHVWDLRSRQVLRTLSAPSKLPVTCVLVMARPPHMGAGSAGVARTGPKRLSPLAPLVKFPGMMGCLQPWESAPVVLDGSQGQGQADFLQGQGLGSDAWLGRWEALAGSGQLAINAQGPATAPVAGGRKTEAMAGLQGPGAGSGAEGTEVAQLRTELAAARAEAEEWRALHGKLHSFAVQKLAAPGWQLDASRPG